MRGRLYRIAIDMIGERGYGATTLRDIAAEAGVSAALVYRYFPNKGAILLALYDGLSLDLERRLATNRRGTWSSRCRFALEVSLATLASSRLALRALVPILVADERDGVFGTATEFSRARILGGFGAAIDGAVDAPPSALRAALGRLFYLGHLGVVLFWLLDTSPEQRASTGLVALISRTLPPVAAALRLPFAQRLVRQLDAIAGDALFGDLYGPTGPNARGERVRLR